VNEAGFVRRRKLDWDRLEEYAARLDGKGERMSGRDLFDVISLYRRVSGDLARARTLEVRPDLIAYLNGLVGRMHFRLYTARTYPMGKLGGFFTAGFPQAVRRSGRYVLAATLLLLVPAVAAYLAVRLRPEWGPVFAPPGYAQMAEQAFGNDFGEKARAGGTNALMHSFYIVNNTRVAILAFGTGIFLGLGSILVTAYNGLLVGGVAALVQQKGLGGNFWAFVSSHGGIELGAIVIAAAAGLRVGLCLVNPGPWPVRKALALAAREAGLLMGGVVVMLALAAMIEAWISPSTMPNGLKYVLGLGNLAALLAYLGLAGRTSDRTIVDRGSSQLL
jgi:uncharacterized membrane protein SpoIIM required for sporulation